MRGISRPTHAHSWEIGGLLVGVGLTVIYLVSTMIQFSLFLPGGGAGPGLFPTIAAVLTITASLLAIPHVLRARQEAAEGTEAPGHSVSGSLERDELHDVRQPAILTAGMVAYLVVAGLSGHIFASIATVWIMMLGVSRRPWWQQGLVALSLGIVSQVLFEVLLGVPLP